MASCRAGTTSAKLHYETGDDAPEGRHYATLRNEEPGRASHVLQGLPIDGAKIGRLRLSAWVKHRRVTPGEGRDEFACLGRFFLRPGPQRPGCDDSGPVSRHVRLAETDKNGPRAAESQRSTAAGRAVRRHRRDFVRRGADRAGLQVAMRLRCGPSAAQPPHAEIRRKRLYWAYI